MHHWLFTVSEATYLNLSLLTGDLWSVLFSVVVERIITSPLFFVALVLVLSGLVLYEIAPSQAVVIQAGAEAENQNNNAISIYGNGYVDKQDNEGKEERTGIEVNDINIVI